jgi:transketolase
MPTCSTLARKANQLRISALEAISAANSGHPGGSLSCLDLLTALYFGGLLKHNPKQPNDLKRDYFVLSKGHASAALYAVLAERGYFPAKELQKFRQVDSLLQGHPTTHIPGVEVAGGSLGQGLSYSAGLALGLKADKKQNHVFTLLGDGELQEGQVWEAAMLAGHYRLNNLTAIVDNNTLQIDGANSEVMTVEPIDAKFKAFGWEVIKIDGHNLTQIVAGLKKAKAAKTKPVLILAKTVKGKGALMAEGNFAYHGVPLSQKEMAEVKDHLASRC